MRRNRLGDSYETVTTVHNLVRRNKHVAVFDSFCKESGDFLGYEVFKVYSLMQKHGLKEFEPNDKQFIDGYAVAVTRFKDALRVWKYWSTRKRDYLFTRSKKGKALKEAFTQYWDFGYKNHCVGEKFWKEDSVWYELYMEKKIAWKDLLPMSQLDWELKKNDLRSDSLALKGLMKISERKRFHNSHYGSLIR